MILTRRQKITIAVLVIYWIVLVILAHIPIPQMVYQARVSDKWLHFLAYLNLVFLLWFSIQSGRQGTLAQPGSVADFSCCCRLRRA